MDINKACDILEISIPFTQKELKKNYYKQALIHHPDKNILNIKEKEIHFHKILDAYKYLNNYLNITNEFSDIKKDIKECNNYEYLLNNFINSLQDFCKSNKNISNLIIEIIKNCNKINKKTFENIDKNILIKIFGYIEKYSDLLNINKCTLDKIKLLLKERIYLSNSIYILNPTLDNLFNNDIYVYINDNEEYYIPLWHDEITYDLSNTKLIFKCIPELPKHIFIDDLNNINVSINLYFNTIFEKDYIDIELGKNIFKIKISDLKLKKKQLYILKNKGISKIDEINIYNVNNKSDIILHINLVNQ